MDKQKIVKQTKKVAYVFMWLVFVTALVVSVNYTNMQEQQITCKGINVQISPTTDAYFVDREMVLKTIRKDGDEKKILALTINNINTVRLEQKLKNNPMVKDAEVYSDMNGIVDIHITQRRPILRIINAFNESFYIDEDGLKMPVSPDFTAHVPVANGFIFEQQKGKDSAQSQTGKDLFKIATYVDKDTFWNAQIEQIFVTLDGTYSITPKLGNQTIDFGNADDIEDKFKRLMLFYKEAMNRVGWETYSNINVSYKNQVVCKKNNNL